MLSAILIVIGAYLIGSVSFAVVVSRAFGLPDPHDYGSGNPGATNVLRTGNKLAALLTLIGDLVKGWLGVFLAQIAATRLGAPDWTVPAAALAVFVGHIYPVFHRWVYKNYLPLFFIATFIFSVLLYKVYNSYGIGYVVH